MTEFGNAQRDVQECAGAGSGVTGVGAAVEGVAGFGLRIFNRADPLWPVAGGSWLMSVGCAGGRTGALPTSFVASLTGIPLRCRELPPAVAPGPRAFAGFVLLIAASKAAGRTADVSAAAAGCVTVVGCWEIEARTPPVVVEGVAAGDFW